MPDPQTATPTATPSQTLPAMVRAKFPGVYDDLSDQELDAKVRAKYPGVYDDLPKPPDFTVQNAKDDQGNAIVEPALVRAAKEFYAKSPLSVAVNTAEGVGHVIAHPIDTMLGLVPLAHVAKSALQAQWDQAVQAAGKLKEAAHGDKLSAVEALGHGLAAVLPLLGPAAADVGEHGAKGDIAGMVGGTLGLLTPFAAKYGLELKNAADPAKADLLRRDATQQVAQEVLAPGNPAQKLNAQSIAPEILTRGLQGSRPELQQIADEGMADAASRIDAAANLDPRERVTLKPILDGLDTRISAIQIGGKTPPGLEARVAALQAQRDFIASHGPDLPFSDLRQLRQVLDQQAAEAKVYERAGNQKLGDVGKASADAAGLIRQSLAGTRPELEAPNADYTFFKRLNDVLDPTIGRPKQTTYVPSGVTGGMTTAGAIVGKLPGPLGTLTSLFSSQALPRVKAFFQSPQWKLADASKKMALADAIEHGQTAKAQGLMLMLMNGTPREASAGTLVTAGATTPRQEEVAR